MTRIAVLFSQHYLASPRRASFHWMAHALRARGWTVVFVCTGISHLSGLVGDLRLAFRGRQEANEVAWLEPDFGSYVLFTPFHPVNLRAGILNDLVRPLYRRYARTPLGELEPWVRAADLVLVESCAALLLVPRLRELNAAAPLVYKPSDDLTVVGAHPILAEAERRAVREFDLICAPSPLLAKTYAAPRKTRVVRHGIDASLFAVEHPDPYQDRGRARAVSVGNMLFDRGFFTEAAAGHPEVDFHVIGGMDAFIDAANVHFHGELPFRETVAYLQHADIGLAPYRRVPGAEYLVDTSNKLIQYTYCGLPIVAPDFVAAGRGHIFGYDASSSESIVGAVAAALAFDRRLVDRSSVRTWDEMTGEILTAAGLGG